MVLEIDSNLECSLKIGTEKYLFFFPLELGSFVVRIWRRESDRPTTTTTSSSSSDQHHQSNNNNNNNNNDSSHVFKQSSASNSSHAKYAVSIYEHGAMLHPSRDSRFSTKKWANQMQPNLDIFTKDEVEQILRELSKPIA